MSAKSYRVIVDKNDEVGEVVNCDGVRFEGGVAVFYDLPTSVDGDETLAVAYAPGAWRLAFEDGEPS